MRLPKTDGRLIRLADPIRFRTQLDFTAKEKASIVRLLLDGKTPKAIAGLYGTRPHIIAALRRKVIFALRD